MKERFSHIRSADEAHRIESEEFAMRYASFLSDPVGYLEQARMRYLDDGGDDSFLVEDLIDEMEVYLEHAVEVQGDIESRPRVSDIVMARMSNDYNTSSEALYSLLKDAGFTYDELRRFVDQVPDDIAPEDMLQYRGDLVILNKVYQVGQ